MMEVFVTEILYDVFRFVMEVFVTQVLYDVFRLRQRNCFISVIFYIVQEYIGVFVDLTKTTTGLQLHMREVPGFNSWLGPAI